VPTEFGKLVKIQEAEQQIVTHYEVYDERPSDAALLIPALDAHEQQLGRTPRRVTADAGFFSGPNEATAHARGVKRIAIPNRSTKSAERKKLQKKRWFRKRRHGLNRCQASRP
jgi:IS5 family transposase